MLEATSGGHERPVPLAREADGAQRAVEAAIRTARRDPQSVARLERRLGALTAQRFGRQPADADRDAERAGGVTERRVRRAVGTERGVEIAHDADPHPHGVGIILGPRPWPNAAKSSRSRRSFRRSRRRPTSAAWSRCTGAIRPRRLW